MKSKKIITLAIVVLLIIAVAVTSIVLAGGGSTRQGIEEKDRTSVILVPEQRADGTYTGKVDVYLEMDDGMNISEEDKNVENENVVIKDAASVASFQIGLNIYATTNEDITSKIKFEYDSRLQENAKNKNQYGVELARQTQTPITTTNTAEDETQTTTTIGEKLNLYFVGTQELNDVNSSEPLKVGTITFDKKAFGNNATIVISPEGKDENGNIATIAASVGHNSTEITTDPIEDRVEFILSSNNGQEVNPGTGDSDDDDSGNTSGDSGYTGDDSGDDTGNTGDDNGNTESDNGDGSGDSEGGNETGSGNEGNIGNGSGNNGNEGSDLGGQGTGSSGEQSRENNGNGDTSGKSTNKPSILKQIKTGANRSLTRIIIPLVVLIVMAVVVIFLKTRIDGKKSKH